MNPRQRQSGGDSSVNLQAETINVSQGLSVRDVKEIALDVFRENFHKLSAVARETAHARAEELVNRFLVTLQQRNPTGTDAANDPDMQYALFSAQKEYARSGDTNLGDILVDLLVDRTRERERNVMQIVLNESIDAVAKLTPDQIAALSVMFLLKYTRYLRMENLASLADYVERLICPFVPDLSKNATCYQHLEYAGAGSVSIGSRTIESIFKTSYPGLFSRGFSEDELAGQTSGLDVRSPIFIRCLHDEAKWQVASIDLESLKRRIKLSGLEDHEASLTTLLTSFQLDDEQTREVLSRSAKCMDAFLDIWNDSQMKNMTLTSVGIAIGHANLRRVTREEFDLTIWIN